MAFLKQTVFWDERRVDPENRILGIDFGSKRIGLSMSDPLGIIATPFATLQNDANIWNRLREIVKSEAIGLVVIGMPMTLRGEKREKAKEVEAFARTLVSETGLEVLSWDERYSTSIAQQTMLDMNTKKKNRNAKDGTLDSMAAAIILQSYLDSKKKSLSC
jgi:putative Holliday junction resolvase